MIGFIGLGVMGEPMARNLVAAGHDVRRPQPHAEGDRRRAQREPRGGRARDVVITMLPDSRRRAVGRRRRSSRASPGPVDRHVDDPPDGRRSSWPQRGVATLDAPVSGGDVGAQQGTLSIMVGGADEDFERARPILEAIGTHDRARRRARRGPDRQGLQPDRGRADHRGRLRGARARLEGRRGPGEDPRRARRRPGRQPRHGDAPAQLPGARLHARLPGRPAPQGPEHRARVRRRLRRSAAGHEPGPADVPRPAREGPRRRRPLRPADRHRGGARRPRRNPCPA